MKELRFHRDLYSGDAVDRAVETFEGWADVARTESPTHWIVQISGRSPAAERRIAGELSNFALGLTAGGKTPLGTS
ncbi:MAG: HxsD-like protein [Deltaproteobacteria bacterium]|nr:HxsD-like protein [Deltaproteobacteria bacterium]